MWHIRLGLKNLKLCDQSNLNKLLPKQKTLLYKYGKVVIYFAMTLVPIAYRQPFDQASLELVMTT